MSWLQIGQPHFLISRPGKDILPISICPDLSMDFEGMDPLPSDLIGWSQSNTQVNSLKLRDSDQILLLSRSWIPATFYSLQNPDLQSATRVLSEADPNEAFWIAQLTQNQGS